MGAFDFRHPPNLEDDISAVRQAAIDLMDKDPIWSHRLINVATAASAWETLIHDRQVRRRFRSPGWTGYACAGALLCSLLSVAVLLLR